MAAKIINRLYTLPRRFLLSRLKKRGLTAGGNFYSGAGVSIDSTFAWLIKIGDDVTLADRVYILAHDASTKYYLNYTRIGKVDIGNGVFIGTAAVILPGVTIGDNVVIGAGSVVNSDIPSRSVATGNPAKVVAALDDFIARKKEEMNSSPCFGKGALNTKKKIREMQEMIESSNGRVGYIF